nr:GntR family transcriptional regulator [Granulicella sp. dw_53]
MVHHETPPARLAITDCRLDRQSFVPLYRQIKDLVLDRIEHGDLATRDLIPSETRLGAAFQVSRLTVRQALYELRMEGYIIRDRGRGTFVGRAAV